MATSTQCLFLPLTMALLLPSLHMSLAARQLLQATTPSAPTLSTIPTLPKSALPPLSAMPTTPKATLPPQPSIPTVPKATLPPLPPHCTIANYPFAHIANSPNHSDKAHTAAFAKHPNPIFANYAYISQGGTTSSYSYFTAHHTDGNSFYSKRSNNNSCNPFLLTTPIHY
ncbi:hypothetical protein RJ639_004059 [Escallonia herrerae]|uniref:Uncharacterized protein n=1 Tax=Escallonia herrerae TaxID=1293975 RepID=A0AA88W0N9_9ASTE|nr:hypothetical protein RJ639_004059 [Escallonia herrerae]